MNQQELFQAIKAKSSFLCVGLDPDPDKMPPHLMDTEDPVFEFNKAIIEATAQYCVAYKPNLAFYEAMGPRGWESLRKTLEIIPEGIFTIADAKRGDIGNTSRLYARTFFETYAFDSVTVAPYMGEDSVTPFLDFEGKWVILLALTSNKGSSDFQHILSQQSSDELYKQVLRTSTQWGNTNNLMYVVGATQAGKLQEIRQIVPDHFLLVPGVGAQGGSLEDVAKYGMNKYCGLLVNSSRGIIYASRGSDFAVAAGDAARHLQRQMADYLDKYL
ncbi:orotidine-5'-phosphate decarboxylase [Roseivirga sp. BDSF3-8]|uniref:orotidine-5'-phosphate decarboxylase n=1 Tax=Roseivirga sp. BDSF3-8 TaxID=3241598 RepID=UPI00353196F0